MLGMKVFMDTPKDLLQQITARAAEDALGLEIMMVEHKEGKLHSIDHALKLIEGTAFHEAADHILHLDNKNTFGFNISEEKTFKSFEQEMQNARQLGISKAVMHYGDMMPRAEATAERVKDDLLRINDLGAKYGVNIHIENTIFSNRGKDLEKADVEFHQILFDIALAEKLKHIGFCFDMGHGKIYSNNSLNEWLEFLDYLQKNNIPLHFHLHNNAGEDDNHFSFHIAEEKGLNTGDEYTGNRPYADMLKKIVNNYSNAMHLHEVQAEYALPGVDWLQKNVITG